MKLEKSTTISHYKILSEIGKGMRWLPDSSAIIYGKDSGASQSFMLNLYKLDSKTQMETQVSDFGQRGNPGKFVLKQDGKNILALRGSQVYDLILIREFQALTINKAVKCKSCDYYL